MKSSSVLRVCATATVILSLAATSLPSAAVASPVQAPAATYAFDDGTAANGVTGSPPLALTGGADIAAQADREGNRALVFGGAAPAAAVDGSVYDDARASGAVTVEFDARSARSDGNFFTYALGIDQNTYLFLRLRGGEAYAAVTSSSWQGETTLSASVDTSAWHRYALSFQNGYLLLSVDGGAPVVSAQSSVRVNDLLANGFSSSFGKSFYPADAAFAGAIDNVAVWGHGIDAPAEVLATVPSSLTFDTTSAQLADGGGRVTWTSQTPGVTIGSDGRTATITRPAFGQPDAKGTLTATAAIAGATSEKQVDVTVIAEPSEEARALADLDHVRIPGLSEVRSDLTLPTTGSVYGSAITWTSSDTSVVTDAAEGEIAAGVVTRPTDGDREVTLTATAGTASREFRTRVLAAPAPVATTDYVFAHFTNNEESHTDEQMYFATSADGLTWNDTRPAGQPLLTSTIGDLGVRDPYLVRSPQGDTFYLIATDLNIHDRGGWGAPRAYRDQSTNIVVWESHDLVTWSEPRLADVASKIPDAGMAWAPEAFWDAKAGVYYVYWSTAQRDDSGSFSGAKSKIYISTTRDFVTFTDPQLWIERPRDGIIDTTMFSANGKYYRASADAQITVEQSDSVLGQWSEAGTLKGILQDDKYDRRNFEGPELFPYNADDIPQAKGKAMPYGLMADHPNGGDSTVPEGYVPFFTSDPGSSSIDDWAQAPHVDFGTLKKRHGSILPVTATERSALEAAASASTGSLPLTQPANTQSLQDAWKAATALSSSDFTPGSWAGLRAALARAAAVLADPSASQMSSDAARTAVDDAVRSLVAVPVAEPIARYDFSDGTGTDVSGNGHDLILSGGAAVEKDAARGGDRVLALHGGADFARIPDAVFAAADDEVTIDFSATSRMTTGNFFSLAVGANDQRYFLFSAWQDHIRSVISKDTWRAEQGVGRVDVDGAAWHDYRIVLRPGSLALFQDGALVGYDTKVTTTLSDLGGTLAYIGKSFYANDTGWDGSIDDLAIYPAVSDVVVPTGFTIAGTGVADGELTVAQGASSALTAWPSPDEATRTRVSWASSDTSVATVDAAGRVTGVREGTATITATGLVGGATASVALTVGAASADQVRANLRADLEAAAAMVATETTENLPLVTTGPLHGSRLTWASSDAARVTPTDPAYVAPTVGSADPYAGGGRVTRTPYGHGDTTATLTPTASSGAFTEVGSPLTVTVKERPRTAPDVGYASANFATTNGRDEEKIWISSTNENNFFTFEVRNGGEAAIASDADTFGLRDPYLFRSHDGDRYYMIATDLNTAGGDWGHYTTHGSLKIEAWESTDLVHWKRTNGDGNGGVEVNSDLAGMTWAPEAYWDDQLQSYVVFFASRMYQDAAHSKPVPGANGGGYDQVLLAITRDFRTFTAPPIAWQNTGSYRIDSSVFKIGDDYYRLTKNGEPGAEATAGHSNILEKSKVLTSTVTTPSEKNDPATGWQKVDQDLLLFEGPASVKLNPGDPNNNAAGDAMILLSDLNTEHGYIPFMTSASQIANSSWSNRLSQTPGWFTTKQHGPGVTGRVSTDGLPDVRRHGAFVNVPRTVLDATHGWTGITAVGSSTDATYDAATRTLRVAVTAADKGNLAGSVALTGSGWSQTVRLAADGTATVVVPDGVTGTVSVAYDGYTDGLVAASRDEVSGIAAPGPMVEATASPRKIAGKAYVTVTATNRSTVPATIEIVTAYGKKTFTDVQPNQKVSAAFNSRAATIRAGKATVTATATIGGEKTTSTVEARYKAKN